MNFFFVLSIFLKYKYILLSVQSFNSKLEREVRLFKLQFSNSACHHYSIQIWPGHCLESWVELVRKGVTYKSQHNKTNVATLLRVQRGVRVRKIHFFDFELQYAW